MGFNWNFFNRFGWAVLDPDKEMYEWIDQAKKISQQKLDKNYFIKKQLRCGGTWFVGANFLKNDSHGKLNGVSLKGKAVRSIVDRYGKLFSEWDQAQVSICYRGYPQPSKSETLASFNYRKNYFGAHLDGIIPIGQPKRRYAQQYHTFIFGIPLVNFNAFAAPLVVWEGSHQIMRDAISRRLLKSSVKLWKDLDITEIYQEARKEVFLKCEQKKIVVPLGGTYILHRQVLHGVMPWGKHGRSDEKGRMIAYFRPTLKEPQIWLNQNI